VLIIMTRHHVGVFGYFLIGLLVLVGPLAYFAGADSRLDEVTRRRRSLG
jgi:hypothetical protein